MIACKWCPAIITKTLIEKPNIKTAPKCAKNLTYLSTLVAGHSVLANKYAGELYGWLIEWLFGVLRRFGSISALNLSRTIHLGTEASDSGRDSVITKGGGGKLIKSIRRYSQAKRGGSQKTQMGEGEANHLGSHWFWECWTLGLQIPSNVGGVSVWISHSGSRLCPFSHNVKWSNPQYKD